MCEGAPNQTPDHKNSTATGPRPPVLKFLDPPLMTCVSRYFTLQLRDRQTDAELPYPRNPRGRIHQHTK